MSGLRNSWPVSGAGKKTRADSSWAFRPRTELVDAQTHACLRERRVLLGEQDGGLVGLSTEVCRRLGA